MLSTASTSGRSFTFAMGLSVLLLIGAVGCVQDTVVNRSDDTLKTGIKLYNEGQYTDAAGAFRKCIREDPRQYKSYYFLGSCYDQLGQYQQSIQSYKSGIEVMRTTLEGKEDTAFRMKLIDACAAAIAKSNDRGAELDAIQKRASSTQSAEDYLMAAKIYRYSGDADSAVDMYNRAALLAPDNFYAQKDFGLYLAQLKQDKRAEIPLKKAYALNPNDQEVASALRQIGVIPGPSIRDQKDLAKPVVPEGPIPQVDLSKMGKSNQATPAPAPAPGPEAQSPRD